MKHLLPIDGKWVTVSDEEIAAWKKRGRREEARLFEHLIVDYDKNPLKYFLPHGIPWCPEKRIYGDGAVVLEPSKYPEEWKNDGTAFLNDHENGYVLLTAPRRTGKSHHGAGKVGFAACITDPNWPCYTDHGIIYREFETPKPIVIASFSWPNVQLLWQVYRNLLPRAELGPYSPQWGKYQGENGKGKYLNFRAHSPREITLLRSKTPLIFLCYRQLQQVWENFQAWKLHADEQILKNLLRAWEGGTLMMGDDTQAFFTLSGFKLPERPDTGAAGFIKTEIWDGKTSKKVGRYCLDIPSTPDVFASPKKKKELYDQYVNPDIPRTEKEERAAIARYWPGFEPGAGMMFGEWRTDIHVISPLWPDNKVPKNCTLYRVIDLGGAGTTCCLWFAVFKEGYSICFRSLYERGLNIPQICKRIVSMSHNKQVPLEKSVKDEDANVSYDTFEEAQENEEYEVTLLDSRCCTKEQMGASVEEWFERNGLIVNPASGQKDYEQLPVMRSMLAIDREVNHLTLKNEDGTPKKGAPRLYFFEGRADCAIWEIERCEHDETDKGKIKSHQEDHAIDCVKYYCYDDPVHVPPRKEDEEDLLRKERKTDPHTGY